MKGRAKMVCQSIEESLYQHECRFTGVCGKEGENKDFFEATPSLSFSMSLSKSYYRGALPVPGKEYYIDISEATEAV